VSYFNTRLKQLRQEYKGTDKKKLVAAAGGKCQMCDRKNGDEFLFGPTHYLKRRLKFKVNIHIHVIKTASTTYNMVICDGCHMSYHLFNRLNEEAQFGNLSLSQTTYKRCRKCKEMACMCCAGCDKPKKWCECGEPPKKKRRKAAKAKNLRIR
jgi:hypothetical protein